MTDTVPLSPVFTLPDPLHIRPWPDDVIDALGHDPRSAYVETYWLSILGPSTTWLMRRLAAELEAQPAGFAMPLSDTARRLGLGGKGGKHSPFVRAIGRCVQFELAQQHGPDTLAVRRKIPPLTRRQVEHLTPSLRDEHRAWQEEQLRTPTVEAHRRRGRLLALSLLELGEDAEAAERQLLRWRFHPAMARESTAWAWDRHRAAREAAQAPGGDAA